MGVEVLEIVKLDLCAFRHGFLEFEYDVPPSFRDGWCIPRSPGLTIGSHRRREAAVVIPVATTVSPVF